MANFRVIQVKVVMPEKLLDVNTFPKIPWCRFYYIHCLKIISVLIWLFVISKNTLCWFNQLNVDLNLKLTPFSLPPLSFSPSLPISQYLVLSFCTLCLIPHYFSPVLIPHKKRMMFGYDYHCLIDNKCLRTHLLFHLALEYNKAQKLKIGRFMNKT